ncbi:MAG TPA: response regulator [Myxococcota bacterium]
MQAPATTTEPPKQRILFVDDEPSVLDGLQNLLRKQRRRWDMVFATSGDAALSELERTPFDVVVSDMRMPGMDGAALLAAVKERYPHTARIVLSGHAEQSAIERALPVAHQFLSKPCDANVLREVIERTVRYSSLLGDQRLRDVVGRLDTLPSAPATFIELNEAAAKSATTVEQLARIVEKDPAMATKVLQLVNSAYFGLARPVSSVDTAVSMLGIELLRGLTLSAHVFEDGRATSVEGCSIRELQRRSLYTARLSKRLARSPAQGGAAFTAALLHDIGLVVFTAACPALLVASLREVQETGRPLHEVELERIGCTHAAVGAYLLGIWGLPMTIVEAVAYHHTPLLAPVEAQELLLPLHVADALADEVLPPFGQTSPVDVGYLTQIGVAEELETWRQLARDIWQGCTTDRG